jgi:hypothetical protein
MSHQLPLLDGHQWRVTQFNSFASWAASNKRGAPLFTISFSRSAGWVLESHWIHWKEPGSTITAMRPRKFAVSFLVILLPFLNGHISRWNMRATRYSFMYTGYHTQTSCGRSTSNMMKIGSSHSTQQTILLRTQTGLCTCRLNYICQRAKQTRFDQKENKAIMQMSIFDSGRRPTSAFQEPWRLTTCHRHRAQRPSTMVSSGGNSECMVGHGRRWQDQIGPCRRRDRKWQIRPVDHSSMELFPTG